MQREHILIWSEGASGTPKSLGKKPSVIRMAIASDQKESQEFSPTLLWSRASYIVY